MISYLILVADYRRPLVLYAVIDNSGSMELSCGEPKTTDGKQEESCFSRLDMVKVSSHLRDQ